MAISSIGKDKLVFDVTADLSDNDNIGAFVRAGTDGQQISWTNIGLIAAQFTGQVAGMTTNVTIDADTAGVAGNITLTADSVTDIDGLISAWNLANPSNTITLTTGDGSQVPTADITLAGGADGKDGLDVNVINDITVGSITSDVNIVSNFEYDEDTAHGDGDTGAFVLAVRHDADTSLVSADGDYAPLQVDSIGRLKTVTDIDSITLDIQYAEDSAHIDGDIGAFMLSVRDDVPTSSTSADGDYQSFKTDAVGRLWNNFSSNIGLLNTATSVTDSATILVATPLANRVSLMVQNLSNSAIYVGGSGVTTSTGVRVAAGAELSLDLGDNVDFYAIANTGKTCDIRVLEFA